LAISAVSAADNTTSDAASVEKTDEIISVETTDENVSVEENQAILSENNDVGTFNDLQTEINNATEGSVLNLTRDYNGAYSSRIQLDKDLTIDGQGHTLDCLGEGECIAFYSTSGTITLKNLKIINGHNDFNNKGGAIHIEGSAQYTIINCTFNNNWAEDYGGAIYSTGDLDIINSTFKSNTVEDDNGGAIYCEKSVYLENCLFEKNHANVDGGAIYTKNNVNVTKNTQFLSNEATEASSQCYGGAIRSEGNVEVDHATFTF
jgi:predicted outer membrane repeat protein